MSYFYKLAFLITEILCGSLFISHKKSQDKFMELKELLNKAEGRERIFIAIGFLWFVFANLLYVSYLNFSYPNPDFFSYMYNEIIEPLPIWQIFWHYLTFGFDSARLYNIEIVTRGYEVLITGVNGLPESPIEVGGKYRLIGHFLLINLPIVVIWSLDNLYNWVRFGFKDGQK